MAGAGKVSMCCFQNPMSDTKICAPFLVVVDEKCNIFSLWRKYLKMPQILAPLELLLRAQLLNFSSIFLLSSGIHLYYQHVLGYLLFPANRSYQYDAILSCGAVR